MRYYYPDDVVKLPNGETTVGFYVGASSDGSVVAPSLLPVEFTAKQLADLMNKEYERERTTASTMPL